MKKRYTRISLAAARRLQRGALWKGWKVSEPLWIGGTEPWAVDIEIPDPIKKEGSRDGV